MTVSIDKEDTRWSDIADIDALVMKAILVALPTEFRSHDVTVLLTNDAEITVLNKDWRGMDKATNVLSFPSDPDAPQPPGELPMLGDLALAYETIAAEAIVQSKTFRDHTAHLIVHGTLHLLGYDHETDADAAIMEAHELVLLKTLEIADPYQL
jgi:probable rRNA maturation factor